MTVQCVLLENTVLNNPSLRLVTVIKASIAQQTSQMEFQACVLAPMDQYRNPAPREHSLMRWEGGLLRIVKSALWAIIVQLDPRHPLFVLLVTIVQMGQATLNRVLWEHSIMAVGLIILRTVPHVHLAGKDVYFLYKTIQYFYIMHNMYNTALQVLLPCVQKEYYSKYTDCQSILLPGCYTCNFGQH